jgi:hypothetical protein
MNDQYTLEEFAQAIKGKYPEYQGVDDLELANKFLEKYPVYQDRIVEKKNLVGSQEEFEPASEEDFLAYTPTSGQADIDLGSSSIEDGIPSDEQQKAINELAALAQYQDTEERSLAEQTAKEIVANVTGDPVTNVIKGATEGMFKNLMNTFTALDTQGKSAAASVLRGLGLEGAADYGEAMAALGASQLKSYEADIAEKKKAQQIAMGVSPENAAKGLTDLIADGQYEDVGTKFFVEGTYAVADAIRTYAPFLAGPVVGSAAIGADVQAKEYVRRLDDPTLTKSQKMAYAITDGVIETGTTLLLSKFASGLPGAANELRRKMMGSVKEAGKKFAFAGNPLVRSTVGEGIEEGVVSALGQMSEMMYDSAFKDKEFNLDNFNPHEVYDSFVYGALAGGALGGGIAALPSSNAVPHSKVAEDKQKIDEELRAMAAEYTNETDPDIKKAKYQMLQDKLAAFDAINGAGADAYATLNQDEAVQVAAVNRRIAQLQDQIKSGKDLAGIEYNAEQLAEKKAEMEKLYEVKKEIEGKAFSREYAEENQGQLPLFVEDAEGNQVETQAKATPQNVAEQHKTLEKEEVTAEDEQQVSTFELDTEAMAEEAAQTNFVDIQFEDMNSQFLSDNEVPTEIHETLINMASAFEGVIKRLGISVAYTNDADAFAREVEGFESAQEMIDKGDIRLGKYNPETNTLYLYNYKGLDLGAIPPLVDTVRHEFAHGVFKHNIGQNAESRTKLYNELIDITKSDKRLNNLITAVEKAYSQDTEGKTNEEVIAEKEEEAIVAMLVDYAANPSKYNRSLKQKIIDLFNRFFSKYTGNTVINNDTDLMGLARAFERAAKTGKKTEVETKPTKKDTSPRSAKPFTYLQQAQIYYTFNPAAGKGDVSLFTVDRMAPRGETVKVNDYGHFKNWYNKMTGNGRVNSITNMYHIVDGKRRAIKPPKPRLNKDGSVMHIDLPMSPMQRRMEAAKRKREEEVERIKAVNAARTEAFRVMDEFGLDFSRMPLRDFIPREEGMTAEEFRKLPETVEGFEAAIRNMQALMESGFDAKESFKKYFDRDKHLDLYTMGEGDYVTPQEKADDVLTKPDEEGQPRHINTSRASKLIVPGSPISDVSKRAVESKGLSFVDLKTEEGKVVLTMGYDKTMHHTFGEVNLGKYFRAAMHSGVTSSSFLSAFSERKGKALLNKLKEAEKMARELGQESIQIHYVAQGSQYILGNTQAFEVTLDFLFNYYKTAMGEAYMTKTQEELETKRLRKFLVDKLDGAKYINGSSSEPGVLNALRYALPKFMGDNQEFSDYLERNGGKLVVRTREDYEDIYSAILSLVKSDALGSYLAPLKADYEKDIDYLSDPFQFRIKLMDAFLSEKDGLYATNKEYTPEGMSPVNVRRSFVNPAVQSFKIGEVMAVQPIRLEDGAEFTLVETKERAEGDPFAFSLKYPTFNPEEQTLMIPDRRYHYYDLHSGQFEKDYDQEFDKQGLEVTNDKEFFETAKKAIKGAKSVVLPRIRGGVTDRIDMGIEHSLLINTAKRMSHDKDVQIINNTANSRNSVPLFTESTDDNGNTWQVRNRTSTQMWADKWLTRLQDKYRGVFLLQEDVETFKGRTVKESEDFKLAEETMYGKAANDLRFLDERIEQITNSMKTSKITSDELSEYLYALHAEERNKVIEERTEGDVKDGSGISTEEANEILESYSEDKRAQLDDIVSLIRDMQQDTRDTMVKFGLETQEAIDAFESMFSNYIPLSGLATDEESSVTSSYPTGGAGLSVFGDQTKRAKGRKTRAENVLAQAVAQNASVHIEARKNEAMNALYNLVKNNPNPEAWSVIDNANALDPHVVPVRVDGEQKFIRFRDASYANALKNMNVPQTNQFIRLLRAPSSWLRAAFTTQNPEFILSNFSRDIQSAVFNAAAESEIEGGFLNGERAMRDLFNKVGPSLKSLLRGATGREQKADPTIMRYYEEYQADGGKTGWAYMKPLDEIAAELEGAAEEKTRTQEILGKAKNVLDFVEGVNDAFENSIRLASYIAARENGVSRAKAAQFAKNITVNFNKHGEWGQTLNAVYLFFNASVQGTARLGRSLTGLKAPVKPDGSERNWYERTTTAQKMAGGLTIFSGMLTMLGMAMSDEDEDGELYWTKIPDYVKERNLVIMRPDGKNYFKIPMPYGYNVFANMGTAAVEGAAGTRDFASGSMFVASSFINSFSPISFGQSKDLSTKALKSVIPTPLKPMVDIATNETYFGSPVYSKRWDDSVPASSMSFRSPESVKSFFSWMNDATGGSQEVPGAIDMNPDKLWYGIEYFMGGPGLFVERTSKTVRRMNARVVNKEDVDIAFNDVPMLRIIYGEPSKYYDMEKYADRKNLIKGLYNEVERTGDNRNPRYKGVFALKEAYLETDRELKKLRKRRKEARNIKDFGKRTAEIQRLMDLERKQIMRFNKYYSELRED